MAKKWMQLTEEERTKEQAGRRASRARLRDIALLNAIAATVHAIDMQPRLARGSNEEVAPR
jgi:hypothetical protein